ncbi:MAG: hypothetical protein AAFO69_04265, partial [Bacteroidota bacterium]
MKRNTNHHCRYLCLFAIFCGLSFSAVAQHQVQIVTKTITKTIPYREGDVLKILAEKANVVITTWSREEIGLSLRLISKHKKKEIAENELYYLKYEIKSENGIHVIRNFFASVGNFRNVKGALSCEYELKIPRKLAIELVNKYGRVSIEGLDADLNARLQFVELRLTKCEGTQLVNSFFGEILTSDGGGTLVLEMQKTNAELVAFKGAVSVLASYGKVNVTGDKLSSFTMEGERTEASLLFTNPQMYNYDLTTSFSRITLPDRIDFETQSTNGFVKAFHTSYPL